MVAVTLGLAMALAPAAGAGAAELKVIAGGSMTASLNALAPAFERASGHKLDIRFAATPELIRMATSDSFDLGIVPLEVVKNEGARAKFAPSATTDIAHIGFGVAVRAGPRSPTSRRPRRSRRRCSRRSRSPSCRKARPAPTC